MRNNGNGWREALTKAVLSGDADALALLALARKAAIGAEGNEAEAVLRFTGELAETHPHVGEAMRESMRRLSHLPY
jgi:hypothetical protein